MRIFILTKSRFIPALDLSISRPLYVQYQPNGGLTVPYLFNICL